ncbi:MAG TPA: UDP-glucose/GDP-mannose dehydrogenase family protein [Terriglobales bacterium]|nr:UDP-glucose/GDP-mannose dehydrogenase family protein [Terriglobales bacterium]
MRIAVIGSGYVGLVAAACFAEIGHQVISIDNDAEKIAMLQDGGVPIHEEFLPELLERHRGKNLTFSTDLPGAVKQSQAIFIAVGTPSTEQGDADLSYVEQVSREVAGAIDDYKIVVEKSTVPVFTSNWVRRVMLLDGADPDHFDVASNPEFLREGTAVGDFLYPDRIVVGADTERCASVLKDIYEPLTSGAYYKSKNLIPNTTGAPIPPPIIITSTKSAELIKHASNAFLATKISFINAVANICEAVGADIKEVCDGIGSDSRIGRRFLNPGVGYGGSCFPKDLKAFSSVARETGYDFRMLQEVMNINAEQRARFLRKVRNALWTLKGKRLAVLGLAFKGGTDDIRESPAIEIVKALLKEGCEIRAFDPAAAERAKETLPSENMVYCESAYEAANGADALLILTDWPEFAKLDLPRLKASLTYPIVVDGRNLHDPAHMAANGFIYSSVGRADVQPSLTRPPQKDGKLAATRGKAE